MLGCMHSWWYVCLLVTFARTGQGQDACHPPSKCCVGKQIVHVMCVAKYVVHSVVWDTAKYCSHDFVGYDEHEEQHCQ